MVEKYIEEARAELMEKSYQDIQTETALKWAARAYAAYEIVFRLDSDAEQIGWFHVGEEYRHEALEHSALIEDEEISNNAMSTVRGMLSDIRDAAIEVVYSSGQFEQELEETAPEDSNKEEELAPQDENTESKQE